MTKTIYFVLNSTIVSAFMEPDHIGKRYRRKRSTEPHRRQKREAPYVIYPEILVIVDYDGYRYINSETNNT